MQLGLLIVQIRWSNGLVFPSLSPSDICTDRSRTRWVSKTWTWSWPLFNSTAVISVKSYTDHFSARRFWILQGTNTTWWTVITWKPFLRIKVANKGQFNLWLTASYLVFLFVFFKMAKNGTNLLDKNRVDKTIHLHFWTSKTAVNEFISKCTTLNIHFLKDKHLFSLKTKKHLRSPLSSLPSHM